MFSDGNLLPSSSEELEVLIRKNVESCLHITSSAPMGGKNDPKAVVDNKGKVYGLNGLYIADASILPDVPSVATNPTVIMAAEYIADQIKKNY
ncbi:GMC family oxidoreductase [Chryseobacterium sp. B21-037]|uniref:GMC family oxidoreductase n=1 Tax=Chryseobacterium sp. B21-037 TaxID=2926038 RepID=UPI002358304A|nr:GMC family oxidoreductase [Chryseobacterium sp. B21-037]MDC8107140.1 GMC family oxidoreductase [Chryseobacterium sp. B21-037]WBV56335.1 GMC family oxidoreductase [Chryseobacterium daecheongense]